MHAFHSGHDLFLWLSLDQIQALIKDERLENLPAGLPTPLEFRVSLFDN